MTVLASFSQSLVDLGIPGIAGAIVGALIAHYASKSRSREDYARTLELVAYQDERTVAQDIRKAAREFAVGLHAGTLESYGQLHNEWQDRILFASQLVRSEDLQSRARAGLYVVFLSTLVSDEFVEYALTAACDDIDDWTSAWLRRDENFPAPRLPTQDGIRELVHVGGNRVSIEPLNELLARES